MNRPALERAKEMCAELDKKGEPIEMGDWGYLDNSSCGTIGCLAGWMTLDPELRRMGLRNESDSGQLLRNRDSLKPWFADDTGDTAMILFLSLEPGQEFYLFNNGNENSWSAAAERIQDVLDGRV